MAFFLNLTQQSLILFSRASYHIQFHSHYRGCYNLDENSGLLGAPKSTTSVPAADVNDHRCWGTPRTISLQHNQRRGREGIRHSGEFRGHHTNQAYYKSGITSPEYPATDSFDIDIQALRHGNPAIVISTCCHELPPKLRRDRLLCES